MAFIIIFGTTGYAGRNAHQSRVPYIMSADSIVADTLAADTLAKDTAAADSTKESAINAPIIYEASDSIVLTKEGFAYLYGKGKVNYENIELTADVITMNMDSSTVFAHGVEDSTGNVQGKPVFKDGGEPYESKQMRYNFKSKKGFINNVTTQQGEGYLTSIKTKKSPTNELYLDEGMYTTCSNHEHPHFYLKLTKAKMRPKKNVVFGPAYIVVEDVPIPFLCLPFGFFPFTSSYSSGILMPSVGDELERGYYLKDGGYYFAINDNIDLRLTGDIYTKGSWGVKASTNYVKRYKFSGSFDAHYQVSKLGEKNMPDYSVSKDFRINWTHRQDAKANPFTTFSASVNFSTSSYDKNNIESQYNAQLYSQSTKTSSISYSYITPNQRFTFAGSFNLSQNTQSSTISMTLPDLNISMKKWYPLKKKNRVGKEKWYEKISIGYTGQIKNSITTQEDKLFKSNLMKDWKNGISHNIPISATFQLFKYINVTPSFNYYERWYTNKVKRTWDETAGKEKLDTIYGFNRVYNYNFSISMNTRLYGFYTPIKALSFGKIEKIRHVITPTVSFSAAPDFGKRRYGFYDTYSYIDQYGERQEVQYNMFANGSLGSAPSGKQGNINFSLGNNLEMKVKSDKDSTGTRIISLIDNFNIGMSYNLAAEKKNWSDMNMDLRIKLWKNTTLNLSTTFATYAYTFDKNGNVVEGDRTEWSYGRFGRFTGLSRSFSYTFNNETWKKWFGGKDEEKDKKKKEQTPQTDPLTGEPINQEPEEVDADVDNDGYMKFKMPWSLSINYSVNLTENRDAQINTKTMRYPFKLTHNLSANGNLSIGSRWNINMYTSYDFEAKKLAMTNINITRDLHCFSMTASIQLGVFNSYNFTIRASSSLLQDLKWEKRNSRNSNIQWY